MENKEYKFFHGYNKNNQKKATALRKNMTKEERKLWYEFLRDYSIKVYRQRPIDNYIVDFYCAKAGLIIEVDGSQHYMENGEKYDKIRTEILERYNLKVIRFSNSDIKDNFYGVCETIDEIIKQRRG